MGEVFSVFDKQDSGNICFGIVNKNNEKLFVKYAGANTINYNGSIDAAINTLKKSTQIYKDLKHKNLIELKQELHINNGFALVFEWIEGENLHPHWKFNTYEKHHNPNSPYFKYKHMSIEKRLDSLNKIFEFQKYAESKGYIAIDLYDGSIMYDFKNDITKICDIDFYHKGSVLNDLGKNFWGSSRFKSPEENIKGSIIDKKSNVYTLGALAFGLLGEELNYSIDKWNASEELYYIALKAVNKERDNRYNSVAEFFDLWSSASQRYLETIS